jgi:predicted exporter/SAM-dependent methyltransferase
MKTMPFNWRFLLVSVLVTAGLFAIGLHRLDIDTDIIGSLPKTNPVISDATYLLLNHPMQNQVVVDVFLEKADLDLLIGCGKWVETQLKESGLFKRIGMEDAQALMPGLLGHVSENLPALFSAEALRDQVMPLLKPEAIKEQLTHIHSGLLGLESIGQEALISKDPLNFRGLVLSKLSHLIPSTGARIHRGNLISADNRHLLLIASPISSSTATKFAASLSDRMARLSAEANRAFGQGGQRVILTPVGAYRAAFDNERIIKKDVASAVGFSTIGIALLLLFAFSRPVIGLFSLLPAVAGTMLAFFAFSLFHKSISIMVIGFGGAIISLTVDQGIAYLLFLDRPYATSGKMASKEVWAMSLLAVLTTLGAYGALCFSGFPVFEQLGQFTMWGLGLCFLFVHLVFPKVFPTLPPGSRRSLHLQRIVDALGMAGNRGLWIAVVFAFIMVFFAKPVFDVSLQAMNTVSTETMAAEQQLTDVWGGIFDKVYLLAEGQDVMELQQKGDMLVEKINRDLRSGVLASGFVSSMVFPGQGLRQQNIAAWKQFWSSEKIETVKHDMEILSSSLGFSDNAFAAFYEMLRDKFMPAESSPIPDPYLSFLGISGNQDGSKWIQVSTLTTGPHYDAKRFHDEYTSSVRLFDPLYFSESLGKLLLDTSMKLFLFIVISVVILLCLLFFDLPLALACLLPVIFAFISTLGTLKMMGRPLDIPGLMLSVIVFGMGVDYSVYFVRSYQHYGNLSHPSFSQIRMAVFLSSITTLIGFGAMCTADHSLLQSTGITAFLGIAYSLIGAFVILPPALSFIHRRRQTKPLKNGTIRERALHRYRGMEAYPRLFARFKMRLDPMFSELGPILQSTDGVRTILDIGCGYGVPAAWLLERFEAAHLWGIEPSAERVRVASIAVGQRGDILLGQAPEIPKAGDPVDLATMIDMAHFLADDALYGTLAGLREQARNGGKLIVRASVWPKRRFPWAWWVQNLILRVSGTPVHYRSADRLRGMIQQAGWQMENLLPSGSHEELVWLIGKKA